MEINYREFQQHSQSNDCNLTIINTRRGLAFVYIDAAVVSSVTGWAAALEAIHLINTCSLKIN